MAKDVLGLPMSSYGTPAQRYSNDDRNVDDHVGVGVLSPKEVNPMGVAPISGNRSGLDKSDGLGGKCC